MTIGYVQLERGHMGVNVFESRLSKDMNHILQLAGYILGIIMCVLVSWRALILTQSMIENMTTKSGMVNFPLWPFPLAIALGHGLLVIAFIQVFIRGIATGQER
jgi:TRAP-type C4-dicarboxylate transport system permease small subunit